MGLQFPEGFLLGGSSASAQSALQRNIPSAAATTAMVMTLTVFFMICLQYFVYFL